jgi:hypothetical protein
LLLLRFCALSISLQNLTITEYLLCSCVLIPGHFKTYSLKNRKCFFYYSFSAFRTRECNRGWEGLCLTRNGFTTVLYRVWETVALPGNFLGSPFFPPVINASLWQDAH